MRARLRPPADADAEAVLEVILARDRADLGVPDFTLEDLRADWGSPGLTRAELSVHGRNRGALRLYESVGMRPTWQAERWEKRLGPA